MEPDDINMNPVPEGTQTNVAPAADNQASAVAEKSGAEYHYVEPDQANNMATRATLAGGKAWLWYTIAGVLATLVILSAGTWYFFKVRGNTESRSTANAVADKANTIDSSEIKTKIENYTATAMTASDGTSIINRYSKVLIINDSDYYFIGLNAEVTQTEGSKAQPADKIIETDHSGTYPHVKVLMPHATYVYIYEGNETDESTPRQVNKVSVTYESKSKNYKMPVKYSNTKTTNSNVSLDIINTTSDISSVSASEPDVTTFDNKGNACETVTINNVTSVKPGETMSVSGNSFFAYTKVANNCIPVKAEVALVDLMGDEILQQ